MDELIRQRWRSSEAFYADRVEMPMYVKEIRYRAHAEGPL